MRSNSIFVHILMTYLVVGIAACTKGADSSSSAPSISYSKIFVYTSNLNDNNVSGFSLNLATGQLTNISGSPFGGLNGPAGMATDSANHHFYVANSNVTSVAGFSLNSSTGALTALAGSPFAGGAAGVSSPVVAANGSAVFTANTNANTVSALTRNTSTGALVPASGSPIAAGTMPNLIAIDPSGRFLYSANMTLVAAGNAGDNSVSAYAVNLATGALTAVAGSPFAVGAGPWVLAIDPQAKFLYVANSVDNTISVFAINSSTGVLTQVTGSPFVAANGPISLAFDTTGTFLYVGSQNPDLTVFSVNSSTGAITLKAGSGVGLTNNPLAIRIDPSNNFLLVTDFTANQLLVYSRSLATGLITAATGSPFSTGSGPNALCAVGF